MLRPTATLLCAILAMSAPAAAQVTLEDLDKAAETADAAMEEFRKRLNDPDPDRALAVLNLLISKGDADQRRMAVRHGLQSTDRAIHATTLRAIFDSKPTLRLVLDPVSDEPNANYARGVNWWGGVINTEGTATIIVKITGFDSDNDCWIDERTQRCLLRMNGDVVSILMGDSWGSYQLDGSGQLLGEQAFSENLAKGSIDLSQ
jgi:hypothetical protein